MSKITIIILILYGFNALGAQHSNLRSYTIQDGLVSNKVRGFFQDSDGFVWIYTWDGISRHEGYRFRNHTQSSGLQHGLVNAMIESSDGSILVAENDGSIDRINGSLVVPATIQEPYVINAFIFDSAGDIYVATDNRGICIFTPDAVTPLAPGLSDLSIAGALATDSLFYAIGINGSPSGILNRQMKFVSIWSTVEEWARCIYKDHGGKILVGTSEGLKTIAETPPGAKKRLVAAPILPNQAPWTSWGVRAVIQSADGTYWIGTDNGLIKVGPDGDWRVFSKKDGLPANEIRALFLDRSQMLWIGTDLGVANMSLKFGIDIFDSNVGLKHDNANAVFNAMNGSTFCILNNKVLCEIEHSGAIITHRLELDPKDLLLGFLATGMDTLIVQSSGLQRLPSGNSRRILRDTRGPRLRPGMVAIGNYFYLNSDMGLVRCPLDWDCALDTTFAQTITCLASDHARSLIIGTWSSGAFLRDLNKEGGITARTLDLSPYLPDKAVRSLLVSKTGDIWIGTRYRGVARLQRPEGTGIFTAEIFDSSDGLLSDWILSMAEDVQGNIWIGSSSGLDKLVPRENSYQVFSFSRVHDLYTTIYCLAVDEDQTIWCGTNSGVVRIMDGQTDTLAPERVSITEMTLGGQKFDAADVGRQELRYTDNSAYFSFTAPDYVNPDQLCYSYRLLGSQDTTWSPSMTNQHVNYASLRPGAYTFEVGVKGWNGVMGEPTRIHFSVRAPYWRQAWFIILVSIIGALAIRWFYKLRIYQIKRLQSVRERIATDLHDEIGSTLTHVNILSEIGRKLDPETGTRERIFDRIGQEVQSSAEALDDIIWSVQSKRDVAEDVIARMRRYAAELFESHATTFVINENIQANQHLGMEFRRDLYLIYKELVRNIVQHAAATKVFIDITINTARVTLIIVDNGIGFQTDASTHRSGISNVRKRVERWYGTSTWRSVPDGGGTTVHVEMSLRKQYHSIEGTT